MREDFVFEVTMCNTFPHKIMMTFKRNWRLHQPIFERREVVLSHDHTRRGASTKTDSGKFLAALNSLKGTDGMSNLLTDQCLQSDRLN